MIAKGIARTNQSAYKPPMAQNNGLMDNSPHKRRVEAAKRNASEAPPAKVFFSGQTFRPARGYALIECIFIGAKASSMIAVPQQVHGQQQYAVIRAMGPGKLHFDGSIIKPEWEPGDCVYARVS
jgi:co-chaperonin GroES (HSP10)